MAGAGCGRRRRRRLASANRGGRFAANEGRDGCGRRAGGALPQEGQQEGRDGGRVPRENRRQETPAGSAGHQEQKDRGRGGLRDPEHRDARRFGSVSGSSADADDATERYATRHSAACGVANVVDRTPPCTRSANGERRPTRGERGAPRVERGVEFDVRFDARHDRLVGPVRFPPAVHRRLAPGGFSSRTRSPSGPGRPRDLSIPG